MKCNRQTACLCKALKHILPHGTVKWSDLPETPDEAASLNVRGSSSASSTFSPKSACCVSIQHV